MNITPAATLVDNVTIEQNSSSQLAIKDGGIGETQLANEAVTASKLGQVLHIEDWGTQLNATRWANNVTGTGVNSVATATSLLTSTTGVNAGSTAHIANSYYQYATISKYIMCCKWKMTGTSDVTSYWPLGFANNAGHYARIQHLSTYTADKGALCTTDGVVETSAEFDLKNDGTIYDIMLVIDSTSAKAYIDGVLVATNSTHPPSLASTLQRSEINYVNNNAVAAAQIAEMYHFKRESQYA